ncbi:uncharacterized protein LOC119190431 [Manduca sexta]|uniref:uncharacterized protein LOC119190431 n=1 Tax=Manduca sexta TaxID=7130 RepID=UPI00189086C3|nr:uncharacterized protein LOC119190431 [Manduca sexta]
MAASVTQEHSRQPESTTYWTDSKTTLCWIRTGARSYKPYVAHRIAAIEEHTQANQWRWVPTRYNVADDATRDVPDNFTREHRWFNGPEFLRDPPEPWPAEETQLSTDTELPPAYYKQYNASNNASTRSITRGPRRPQARIRIEAQRSRENAAKRVVQAPEERFVTLPAELQEEAERIIIKASQEAAFEEELRSLEKGKPVSKESRLYALSITFINELICLDSRISAATGVSAATKNPPIVDGEHRATKLWVEHVHTQLHHAGVESVVNYCRQYKWVIRLRPTVKAVVRSCVKCRQRAATPPQPITGDLPPCRLAHHHRPFTYTVRAVHLEVVHSLSTQGDHGSAAHDSAPRSPAEIWSDNGTNFHGAEKELRNTLLAGAEQEASRRAIRWRFIPPGAPFMGGAWERLVRSVKTALTTVLHEQRPHEETLSTLLAEVEFTVNSRPLTHVSVNPEDPEALTPNHFLLGCQGPLAAPKFPAEHGYGTHADLRASQQLADAFWTRWLREYLPELRNRREPRSKGPELHIGDIVRIVDGRSHETLGRVAASVLRIRDLTA